MAEIGLSRGWARLLGFARSFRVPGERRVLAANFISLSVLQYASYFFPLVAIPYLTRVIGVEKFGLIAFAQACVAYASMLVNYGFSYSATRQLVVDREKPGHPQRLVSDVLWAKLLLAGGGAVALIVLLAALPHYRGEYS